MWGFPAGPFSRFFVSYSYQRVQVKDLNPLYLQPARRRPTNNPFLADSLLLNSGGQRRISKIGPSYMYNTIDNPIFPTTGRKLSLVVRRRGPRRQQQVLLGEDRGRSSTRRDTRRPRSACARRSSSSIPTAARRNLPIFEKLFLGGEYSIRGFDIRSVGPRDLATGLVIGGNKSLLFNAEYLISIAGPVRLVLFADAGQVRDYGENVRVEGTGQEADHDQRAGAGRRGDLAVRGRRVQQPAARRRSTRWARPPRSRRRPAPRSASSCRS